MHDEQPYPVNEKFAYSKRCPGCHQVHTFSIPANTFYQYIYARHTGQSVDEVLEGLPTRTRRFLQDGLCPEARGLTY